ncbi:hypothetical protein TrLO_g10975 [Triparma laevis f. longispina]|uniref:Galactose oxidase n=1 Tax=Triparma laevis f. longispina TaxID=1714387 RepID=A0A9W6ZMD8_9STRA|nr:hypothetical protein TrLO_g10975 [Triparma laevis f. longispina]
MATSSALQPLIPSLKYTRPAVLGDLPPVRGGHGCVLADMQIVVFGGHAYLGKGEFEYLNDVWCLDIQSLTWQKVFPHGQAPEKRYGATCQIVGNRMFVFGGRGANGQLFRDMHFLDLVEWTWVPVNATSSGPSPRFYHASLVVGRKLVIHGGWNGQSKCYNDMWVFDTETFTWVQPRTAGLVPPPVYGHSLNLTSNGHIMAFGGASITADGIPEYYNDLRSLNTETMVWERPRNTGDYPSARYSCSMTPIGNDYVVMGGWGYGGMQSREEGNKKPGANTIAVLDSDNMSWSVPQQLNPNPLVHKYGQTVVNVQNHLFMFGGWNGKQATNDLHIVSVEHELPTEG